MKRSIVDYYFVSVVVAAVGFDQNFDQKIDFVDFEQHSGIEPHFVVVAAVGFVVVGLPVVDVDQLAGVSVGEIR